MQSAMAAVQSADKSVRSIEEKGGAQADDVADDEHSDHQFRIELHPVRPLPG
jgi:hypothetical protein